MDQSSLQRPRRTAVRQEPPGDLVIRRDTDDDGYGDEMWPSRMPGSARRYHHSDSKMEIGRSEADVQVQTLAQTGHHTRYGSRKNAIPARRTAAPARPSQEQSSRRPAVEVDTEDFLTLPAGGQRVINSIRVHWLLYAGVALLVMLLGWVLLSVVTNWWQVTQDDWHYGRPRTYQVDQVVGHNDSAMNPTHFIAINLDRHVQVIEEPGGDASKVKIYVGPILAGAGQDLAPVTLTFKDVNGDGRLDMIVNVQDSHFIFINDNGQFRVPRPGENI